MSFQPATKANDKTAEIQWAQILRFFYINIKDISKCCCKNQVYYGIVQAQWAQLSFGKIWLMKFLFVADIFSVTE